MVPILGVAVFVVSMASDSGPLAGHWFPEDISAHGYIIDNLFNTILYLTGFIFIVTGVTLFWFLWKYDADSERAEPVKFTHGSHALEVVWSILPAATLLFIAIYQMNAWAANKMVRPLSEDGALKPPIAEVIGRQFEWRINYAGTDGMLGTQDDVHTVNELHLPEGEEVVLQMKSMDVLHSLFLPNVRVKQDVVPGMKQFVWFRPLRSGDYDIVCAELCGWGHYKMKGRMTVEPRSEFDAWLARTWTTQSQDSFTPVETEE
jgi:cytochrome c oxidase subunit 2